MYGFPAGDGAYAGHIVLGWRAVVLADADVKAKDALHDSSFSHPLTNFDLSEALRVSDAQTLALYFSESTTTTGAQVSLPASMHARAVADACTSLVANIATQAAASAVINATAAMGTYFPSQAITGVQIRVAQEPDLAPLQRSWEVNDVEKELKALFKELFDTYVRPDERYVNLLGTPHLGSYELLHSSLAADGLSIYQGGVSGMESGLYLLRAWRAHNPKRGLHLLKTYLQLLWPNVWECVQMWQDKAQAYPTALSDKDGGNHFLTSRVHVSLPARATNGSDLNSVQYGLRSTLPARFVMNFTIEQEETVKEVFVASTVWRGFVSGSFKGTVK